MWVNKTDSVMISISPHYLAFHPAFCYELSLLKTYLILPSMQGHPSWKLLLESCNLHTVLDCPGGTFQGAGVKTVVLFFELQKTFADSPKSWSVDVRSLSGVEGYDLSVKNPNGGEVITHRTPQEIMDEIAALDVESAEVLANIRGLLK